MYQILNLRGSYTVQLIKDFFFAFISAIDYFLKTLSLILPHQLIPYHLGSMANFLSMDSMLGHITWLGLNKLCMFLGHCFCQGTIRLCLKQKFE